MTHHEGHGRVSPAQVAEQLKGINFPCSKQDLVKYCETRTCPTEIRSFLERMPQQTYYSMADVMQGIGQVE